MRVELITIGDELLLGFTIDTNGAYLARQLADVGVSIARRTSVGDTMDAITSAVRDALDRTGAVITTGGLGPTSDDLSRDAVAKVFGRRMRMDDAHLAWMVERWRTRFGRELPESNKQQAMLPEGARKLENRHGSAPGIYIEDDRGRWVAMLPGVPREMRGMTGDVLLPLLLEKGAGGGRVVRSRTLRTTGIAESLLQDRLTGIAMPKDVALAYLPGVDGVDLRISTEGDSASVDRTLGGLADLLRERAGEWIYAEGGDDLADVLLAMCRAKKMRIAVAESCTGGMLGQRITAIPGSSDTFMGGVIAYANEVKTRELAVPAAVIERHGAVSEETVRAMASGVCAKFGVEVGLAISGVAGPGGGTPEKPVGLVWVAASVGGVVTVKSFQSVGDRNEVRYRGSQAAMELARRALMK